MKIKSFSQQGKRSNNEDYLGYQEHLYMVCDGIGGHVSGERASKFVVEQMTALFPYPVPDLTKDQIQEGLGTVQARLNKILETEPECEKMGTTFTGIFISENFWYAAHIGDSRIYLFRPSEEKMWVTKDHSLVGEMMYHHDITREAGRFHPFSNRISKAMIANSENKINTADIAKIDQLKKGDVLMLCSDGVVEAWGENQLIELFADSSLSFDQKAEKLRQQCEQLSKDNNTALLMEIEEKEAFSNGSNDELQWLSFQEVKEDYQMYLKDQQEKEEDAEEAVDITDDIQSQESPTPVTFSDRNPDGVQTVQNKEIDSEQVSGKGNSPRKMFSVYLLIAVVALVIFAVAMVMKKCSRTSNSDTPVIIHQEQVDEDGKQGTTPRDISKKGNSAGMEKTQGNTQPLLRPTQNMNTPSKVSTGEGVKQKTQTNPEKTQEHFQEGNPGGGPNGHPEETPKENGQNNHQPEP